MIYDRLSQAFHYRFGSKLEHPLLLNSIPKSGTQMLLSLLLRIRATSVGLDLTNENALYTNSDALKSCTNQLLNLSSGEICVAHLRYDRELSDQLQASSFKVIFIFRDPRSVVTSLYHYIGKTKTHPHHHFISKTDKVTAINALINGHKIADGMVIQTIAEAYEQAKGWLSESSIHAIKFEELVLDSSTIISNLLRFLELPSSLHQNLNNSISAKEAANFRKGTIDSWKEELSKDQIEAIESSLPWWFETHYHKAEITS